MMSPKSRWVINVGLFCSSIFYVGVPSPATGISLSKILTKFGATEKEIQEMFLPIREQNVREKREEASSSTVITTNAEIKNNTETQNTTDVGGTSTGDITTSNLGPEIASSTSHPNYGLLGDGGSSGAQENATEDNETGSGPNTIPDDFVIVTGKKYTLPTAPDFDRNIIGNLPEREGEDEAIVETRPYLLHPPFTTYVLIVTIPCIIGWCLLTFVCLWICRPNSPLYREILKRLIEHSQMKQKSVLFSATVLAADKHTGQPASPGEGPSKEK
ncbi:hypothetical protein GE061_013956 [Apolygus lucorum]|uniref:Uncharacterized protein n=1 Tax=Apolygus lucorum TaxID=248454 RepID=A0A8S9XTB3_APOLU|nr:hypothetical protein GE061_013956 [Apolygus lucorum]